MEIFGLLLGVLIGITLGLIGSGGSILSIPILVYIIGYPPSVATTYSLFIVGVSASVGAMRGIIKKESDLHMVIFFGIPSILSILLMRRIIVPMIPSEIYHFSNGFVLTKDLLIMLVFGVLMVISSISMIQSKYKMALVKAPPLNSFQIIYHGVYVGLVSGFVGVGGGFLIIPTLVLAANLTMPKAVATSLVIISANSLIGFFGAAHFGSIDWRFLLLFSGLSVVGIIIGMIMSTKIDNSKLKSIFGWFVLITGIYILIKELFFK